MPNPKRSATAEAPFDALAWALAAALLLLHAWHLARFAVDWPLHDDFTQILAVPGYLVQFPTWQERVGYLVSLSVEHRIASLRLAGWLGSLLPGGLDFRLLIAIGNAFAVAAGVIATLAFPRAWRATGALLAALLLTSPTHYGAQYWANGALQHFGVAFYAIAALYALARRTHSLVPVALALVAAFTSANGLMVFPAAALLWALSGRRTQALAWMVAAAALFAGYFIGYETPGDRTGVIELLREPARLVAFGLVTLGGIGEGFGMSLLLGMLMAISWVALFASGAWRGVPDWVVAAMLFLSLTCAAIAFGRAALGDDAATLSRYRVYSALATLCTLAAVLPRVQLRWKRSLGAIAIALAAGLFLRAWSTTMPLIVELAMLQKGARDHFAADGRGFYGAFPTREFGDFTLTRARGLGRYEGARRAAAIGTFTGGFPPVGPAAVRYHSYVQTGERVVTAGGAMRGRHRTVDLWLADDHQAFRATLHVVRFRGGERWEMRTGFHGTASLAGLPPGRYRVGFAGDGARGVTWTGEQVDIP